jgi:hypothetical protein
VVRSLEEQLGDIRDYRINYTKAAEVLKDAYSHSYLNMHGMNTAESILRATNDEVKVEIAKIRAIVELDKEKAALWKELKPVKDD